MCFLSSLFPFRELVCNKTEPNSAVTFFHFVNLLIMEVRYILHIHSYLYIYLDYDLIKTDFVMFSLI